jgi:hypothetical protein
MPRANSGEQWLPLSDVLDEKGGGGQWLPDQRGHDWDA